MIDAIGNYIIGTQNFGNDGNWTPDPFPTPANPPDPPLNNWYGFSDGSNNYILWKSVTNTIRCSIYDQSWATLDSYSFSIQTVYNFDSFSYSPISSTGTIFLRANANKSNIMTIVLSISDFIQPSPPIKDQTIPNAAHLAHALDTPYGYRYFLFTEKGYITKDWNDTYRFFSKTDGGLLGEKKLPVADNHTYYDTFDLACTNRYIFNSKSKYLYHSKVWW